MKISLHKFSFLVGLFLLAIPVYSVTQEVINTVSQGNALYLNKDYAGAKQKYLDAIAMDNTYDVAHSNLGLAYARLSDFTNALASVNQAITLKPSEKRHLLNQGKIYAMEADYALAITSFTNAIAIDANYKEAFYNRGWCYDAQGENASAISNYQQASTIDSSYYKASMGLSISKAKQDLDYESIWWCKNALANSSGNSSNFNIIRQNLRNIRGEDYQFNNAASVQLFKDGISCLMRERTAEAVSAFAQLVAAENQSALAHYMYSRALQANSTTSPTPDSEYAIALNLLSQNTFFSTPSGANLWVDFYSNSTTPATQRLFPSLYDIVLKSSDTYYTDTATVTSADGSFSYNMSGKPLDLKLIVETGSNPVPNFISPGLTSKIKISQLMKTLPLLEYGIVKNSDLQNSHVDISGISGFFSGDELSLSGSLTTSNAAISVTKAAASTNAGDEYFEFNSLPQLEGNTQTINFSVSWTAVSFSGQFTFSVAYFPEINVKGNGVYIADGDTTPSASDGTDFGSTAANYGTVVKAFTLENLGSASLNLTDNPIVAISGAYASEFTVSALPSTPAAAGSSTTFQVTFTPTGGGLRTAALSITNNDSDETPYNFNIQGTGTNAPEMKIENNYNEIVDGDTTPSTSDGSDFGNAEVNTAKVQNSFWIYNRGDTPLNLTGIPIIAISGANAADFSVTAQPPIQIEAKQAAYFTVKFDPSAIGLRTAVLSIANNDFNENPYEFSIQGTGALLPEINITGNGISIQDGDTTPTSDDFTFLGAVNDVASGSIAKEFTIENPGSADLNLTGTPLVAISGANASDFSLTSLPSSTVPPGANAPFQITFDPSATGLRTAIISITCNDSDETPYSFSISGRCGNSPPTAFSLSTSILKAGKPANSIVGSFSTVDPDLATYESFAYSLADGEGDTDNGSFIVDGSLLRAKDSFDYSIKKYYSIRAKSTDSLGLSIEKIFLMEVFNVIYSADMTADPGWTLPAKWAYGVPSGQGSGKKDPVLGFTDNNVIGYNLDGDYSNGMTELFAQSSAINCSGYRNVKLCFYRWLGVDSSSNDSAKIYASRDGNTWITIWQNTSELDDGAWTFQEMDMNAVGFDSSDVLIRFGMGPTNSSVTKCGWNIDDLFVVGQPFCTVNFTASPGGSISGSTTQLVDLGGDTEPVTAVPDVGFHFESWTGGLTSTDNPLTVPHVTSPMEICANFAVDTYTLTYTAGTNGSISGATPQTVNHGSSGTEVTAVANIGYNFVKWSDGVTTAVRTDTNVTADISVSAEFAIDTYTVTFDLDGKGTRTGGGELVQTIAHGSGATAPTVQADIGWVFSGWDKTFDNITAVTTVKAQYTIKTYTLTYTAGANGTITGTSPQTVDHGASGTAVTAVANANCHFVDWSDGSTANPRTDTNVTADKSVSANFAINTYTLTYTAEVGGEITGTSPQTVEHGADCSPVTALPYTGFHFAEWSDGLIVNPRTDTNVIASATITAIFADSGNFTYTDNGTSITITAYTGASRYIAIPASIDGKPVTDIGNNALSGYSKLTGVLIPDSVTSIGDWAFFGCSSLKSVTIPSGSIGKRAFSYCSSLKTVTIGRDVTSIGEMAFCECSSLATAIINGGIVESWAFYACPSLTSVVFNGGIIESSAFHECSSLANVFIGDDVTSISGAPFWQCWRVKLDVSESNPVYCGMEGVVFSKDKKTLVLCPPGQADAYQIPDGVICIGDSAFCGCYFLTSIQIPDSVTSIIGSTAFYACPGLVSIDVSANNSSYCSVGGIVFSKDKKTIIAYSAGRTEEVYTIPDGVTCVGDGTFGGCGVLKRVSIPDSVRSIGYRAFANCWSLTSIEIPDSVTSIGDWAFACCSKLTSIVIPDSVTSIGEEAFCYCNSLSVAYFYGNAPAIGAGVFRNSSGNFGVYYIGGASGFTKPLWNGYPCSDGKPPGTLTVTFTAGNGGLVNPSEFAQTVYRYPFPGSYTAPVTAKASDGYHFVNWTGTDGFSSTDNPIRIQNVAKDMSITANFAIDTYTISAMAGAGGTIEPSGDVSVEHGSSKTFTVSPSTGYHVADVLVDGASVGAVSSYEFKNLTAAHTISASFEINSYTLTYTAGANGTITGTSPQTVDHGASGTAVTAVANANCHFVDWSDGNLDNPRTDTNVTADINVTANFAVNSGSYGISGRISGDILRGIILALTGGESRKAVSSDDGAFSFDGLANGLYTLTPTRDGYTFTPPIRNIMISNASQSDCNFTAVQNSGAYSISGTVGGDVQEGVEITLSGELASTTMTSANGSYSFTGLAKGSYSVKASLAGYAFAPVSQNVSIDADQTGIDFTAKAIGVSGDIVKLSFSSSHRESVGKIAEAFEQYSTDRFSISTVVQFPEGFDLAAITEQTAANTELSFDLGFYSFSETLDHAVKRKLNGLKGGSVSFKMTETDEIKGKLVTVEKIDIKWDKKRKLTLRIVGTPASNAATNVVDLSGEGDSNKITGKLDSFNLAFNDAEVGFAEGESLAFTGKKSTKTVTKGKGEEAQNFELSAWKAGGTRKQ